MFGSFCVLAVRVTWWLWTSSVAWCSCTATRWSMRISRPRMSCSLKMLVRQNTNLQIQMSRCPIPLFLLPPPFSSNAAFCQLMFCKVRQCFVRLGYWRPGICLGNPTHSSHQFAFCGQCCCFVQYWFGLCQHDCFSPCQQWWQAGMLGCRSNLGPCPERMGGVCHCVTFCAEKVLMSTEWVAKAYPRLDQSIGMRENQFMHIHTFNLLVYIN